MGTRLQNECFGCCDRRLRLRARRQDDLQEKRDHPGPTVHSVRLYRLRSVAMSEGRVLSAQMDYSERCCRAQTDSASHCCGRIRAKPGNWEACGCGRGILLG